jgi:hypothetical protein
MPAGQTGLEHLVSARGANERSICRLQAWVSAGSPRDSVQLEAPSDPCNRQDPDRRSGAGLSDQSQADGIRPGAHCRFRSEIDVRRCRRKGFINGPQRQVLRRFAGRAGCPEPIGFPTLPGLPWIERDGGGLAAGERQGRSKRLVEREKYRARWDRGRTSCCAPIPMRLARVVVLWLEFALLRAMWYSGGSNLKPGGDPTLLPSQRD